MATFILECGFYLLGEASKERTTTTKYKKKKSFLNVTMKIEH